MMKSAFEEECNELAWRLNARLRQTDRGALLGLMLSVVPVPPVAIVGLILNIINLRLGLRGQLQSRDTKLAKLGIVLSIISLLVGTLGLIVLLIAVRHVPAQLGGALIEDLRGALTTLWGTFGAGSAHSLPPGLRPA